MGTVDIVIWSFVAVIAFILAFKISWDISSKNTYDKTSTKRGVDIYIDDENKVMYVSLNNNTSNEEIQKIRDALRDFKTYEIIVLEEINDINFL